MPDNGLEHTCEPNPFLLTHCPDCGYMLTGLPMRGRCPECGFAYDESLVVLRGWACGSRADGANSRFAVYGWLSANIRLILCLGIMGVGVTSQALGPALAKLGLPLAVTRYTRPAVFLVIAAALIAFSMYRRRQLTRDGAPPVQLYLSPEGFGQRNGPGPMQLHPWGKSKKPYLKRRWNGYYRIRSYRWHSFRISDSNDPIDFQIRMDQQTARRLQERIDAWYDTAMQIRLLERMLRKKRISMEEFMQRRVKIEERLRRRGLARMEPQPLPPDDQPKSGSHAQK